MNRKIVAILTMLLGLVLILPIVVTFPVAAVIADTCQELAPFDSNEEASVSGVWGSITFDNTSSTLALHVNAGYTVQVCVKAGSAQQGDGPENAGTFGEGDYSIPHSTGKDLSHFDYIVTELPTTTTEASTTTSEGGTTTTTEGGTTTTTEGGTTTTEGGTTTTTEGSTTTSEGGTTTTSGVTTTPPSETSSTLVVVNPICIDCNNATQADLMQLDGVNATLALAIIANRPYETLQDLVTKGVMTPGQIILILAINQGTGAFASDACLNAVGATTTTVAGETTTTAARPTITRPGVLPFSGIDAMPIAALASAVMGLGLMVIGWTMRKERS